MAILNENCWYNSVCTEECTPSCIKYLEMKYLMDESYIPKKRQIPIQLMPETVDYNSFTELAELKANIVEFVSNGKSLYLYSKNTGNGKTSWSIKLMLRYFDRIWAGNGFRCRGVFVHVPTLLAKLKDFGNKTEELYTLQQKIIDCDLVIFDDIGVADLSNYDKSQLISFVDQRTLAFKSCIFTGNLGLKELKLAVGDRLASRIWGSTIKIELFGKDERAK